MDDLELPDLLGEGTPEAGSDTLARIVRRHGRLRARQARIAATTAVIVALAGAGVGIGLSQAGHPTIAASPPRRLATAGAVPPGLRWASTSGAAAVGSARPGVFGWLSSRARSSLAATSAQASTRSPGEPLAALLAPESDRYLPSVCTTGGCGPVYSGESLKRLFERNVGGVTIEAQLVRYVFAPAKIQPEPLASGASSQSGHAISGSGATRPGVVPGDAVRLTLPCFSPVELLVTVSRGHSTDTLAVPGAASVQPFSVLASGVTGLGVDDVVLAVAHTSGAVRTVTAEFPGGGDDHMSPVDGWSVLADRTPPPKSLKEAGAVTLIAVSATGATLERVTLPATGSLATATTGTCRYWVAAGQTLGPPARAAGSSTGSGSGSGSATGSPGVSGSGKGSATGATSVTGKSG